MWGRLILTNPLFIMYAHVAEHLTKVNVPQLAQQVRSRARMPPGAGALTFRIQKRRHTLGHSMWCTCNPTAAPGHMGAAGGSAANAVERY